ncbi:phosphonate metabolism protein/1,5-bisphosphokinase (PRPP-forming) PhnN [Aureimonas sp. AU22]|uniref:phosphonate metabolism protein/1,5-bisphosphokinase (PRPP-forming) PhnN n=1 Tax=Aureimonas sp. AU22 TaxID=1638162 RepID=UPI000AAAD5B0|nr:phosphonate metabolism protein/1,5-bisphosphokinase (PRPP-forming) PhnN [Aureimonas sp. AU22]
MREDRLRAGLLVAVVGPSGAGKDTLIRLAFESLAGEPRIQLARRVITRPCDGGTEEHDSLDPEAFSQAEAAGRFCLTWRAHGLAYALPRAVEESVRAGNLVVANLSRRSLGEADARFGGIAIVEITAPRAVLVARIAARGRETPAEVEARLARQVGLDVPDGARSVVSIDNCGAPEAGAEQLRRQLVALAASVDTPSFRRSGT